MFAWLREFLEIKAEYRERKLRARTEVRHEEVICQSCEMLKEIVAAERYDKQQLLNRLLKEPESPVETQQPVEISKPRMIPWNVRRQMLEDEDRKKAQLLRNAPKPDTDVQELEKEMDIAQEKREGEAAKG